jgi:SAM-dependent methyltransferase
VKRVHQTSAIDTPTETIDAFQGATQYCPACGASGAGVVVYRYPPFAVARCAHCRTLHLSPVPSTDALRHLYNNNYYRDARLRHGYLDYAASERHVVSTYRRRLLFLKGLLPPRPAGRPRKIHELGAALGLGLDLASTVLEGEVSASDVSAEAVEECRSRGFDAALCDGFGISAALAPESLDIMFAFDVVEHLPSIPVFRRWLASVIRPGGVFFVTTPDMGHPLNRLLAGRSPSIKIPQHVSYFTTDTLQGALAPEFTLHRSGWDLSCADLGLVLSRLGHVVGLPALAWHFGPSVWVPNGMRMYAFHRTEP